MAGRRERPTPLDDEAELREALARAVATGAKPVAIYSRLRISGEGTADEMIRRQRGSLRISEGGDIARLMRRLPGGANRGGRTPDLAGRLADYRSAILALAEKGYRPSEITAASVMRRLHRSSESQLRKDVAGDEIGGWKEFRAEVLRSR